jgi:hypothetical protein
MKLPLELNPFTRLWHTISSFKVLCHNLPQYLKLDEREAMSLFWVMWNMNIVFQA